MLKGIILIVIGIFIQGCGGGSSSEGANSAPAQEVTSAVVVNKNAINLPMLPAITEALPTVSLKNNLNLQD